MASTRVLLRDLPSNSKFHVVRVQVANKTAPVQNFGKAKHQRILLRDESGAKIRLTLFGDFIDIYNRILEQGKTYDIMNVNLKPDAPGAPYLRGMVMYINHSTSVVAVDEDVEVGAYQAQYTTISDALQLKTMDDTFDIVAVVVDVSAVELKTKRDGNKIDMSKFFVTDDSCDEIVPIVMWGVAAQNVIEFETRRNKQGVIGFEGLRKSTYRGEVSFIGIFGVVVCFQPDGPRAEHLKSWFDGHKETIVDRFDTVEKPTEAQPLPAIKTLSDCLLMEPSEVKVNDIVRIVGSIEDFSDTDVRVSVGCSRCGKVNRLTIGQRFICLGCKRPTTCVAKMYFDFTVRDPPKSISLSCQGRTSEYLLDIKANEIHAKTPEERTALLRHARPQVCAKKHGFILTPAGPLLVNNNILRWVLRYVGASQ